MSTDNVNNDNDNNNDNNNDDPQKTNVGNNDNDNNNDDQQKTNVNDNDFLRTDTTNEYVDTPSDASNNPPRKLSSTNNNDDFLRTDTINEYADEPSDQLSNDVSIELVNVGSQGSVHELPTPKTAASPVSHSGFDKDHHDFPDTDNDNTKHIDDHDHDQSQDTLIGSVSGDINHIKKKDAEELKHRLEIDLKLSGMAAINENTEVNYATILSNPAANDSISKMNTEKISASTLLRNQDHYRINNRFFRGYIRQDWHTSCIDDGLDELRAGWVELFFDLIFVACIVHLSVQSTGSITFPGHSTDDDGHRRLASSSSTTHLEECIDHDGRYDFLITAFAQFALLTSFWMEQVMYITHFVLNEHIDELLRVFYMTCVLAMGIFVQNDPAYHIGFFSSYALLRIVSCCMYFRVIMIPRARSHAIYHIILHSTIILILIGLIGVRYSGCALDYFGIYISLWAVEYSSGVLQWTISSKFCQSDDKKKIAIALPLNVPHISERYGLLVMIILGEALIATMTADLGELDLYQKFTLQEDGSPPDLIKVFFFLGIFILSYCIGRLYYNCQPTEEAILVGTKNHALRISKNRARLYIHSHQVLFVALLGYGIGIKLAGKHLLDTEKRWIDVYLPGYSLVVIVICLNVIRVAHPFDANKKIWTFRMIVTIILAICPLFAKVINQAIIWAAMLLCVLSLVATDVEGEQKRKDAEHHESEKRKAAQQHADAKKKQEDDQKRFRRHSRHFMSGIGLL